MLASKHNVVTSLVAAPAFEAKDWKAVVKAVALEVEAVFEQAAGFHWAIVLPDCEEEAPYSAVPATIVPPAVSAIVSVPEVKVWSYFTIEI